MTLDGETVATIELEADEPAAVPLDGALAVAPGRGFTTATARDLATGVRRRAQRAARRTCSAGDDDARGATDRRVGERQRRRQVAVRRRLPRAGATELVVLGCYGRGTLRILRVDRPDLAPVMVVSAAHEMLHGAYERLSRPERTKIDAAIQQAYAGIDDPQLTDLVASYADHGARRAPQRARTRSWRPGRRPCRPSSSATTAATSRIAPDRRRVPELRRGVHRARASEHAQLRSPARRGGHPARRGPRAQVTPPSLGPTTLRSRSTRSASRVGSAESNDLVGPQNAAADEASASVDRLQRAGRPVRRGRRAVQRRGRQRTRAVRLDQRGSRRPSDILMHAGRRVRSSP